MDVLVGYDGSEPAGRALRLAAKLAGGGRITIANVAPVLRFGLPDLTWSEEQETLFAEALAALRGREQVETLALVGDVAGELVAAAERTGVPLVALGTHGHGAVGRLVLGSVSTAVARDAHASVLVVP